MEEEEMSLGEGGTLRVVGNNSVNFNLRERMTSFCFGTRGEGGEEGELSRYASHSHPCRFMFFALLSATPPNVTNKKKDFAPPSVTRTRSGNVLFRWELLCATTTNRERHKRNNLILVGFPLRGPRAQHECWIYKSSQFCCR